MIAGEPPGTTADEACSGAPRTAMTFFVRSLALATGLVLLPGTALGSPATLAALQTVAVADDAGVAQSLAQPAAPCTTQVTVVVGANGGPAAVPAPVVAAPAPEATPPPSYTPPPYSDRIYKDRKSGRSLLIGGITMGSLAYVYTSLAGALLIDRARNLPDAGDRGDQRAFGRAMLIPGIGPALAIPRADTALRAWGAGMAGLTQAVALGMTIVGIHRLARASRLERLSLGAMATAQQAHVSLAVRF